MGEDKQQTDIAVGVLALQGGFSEHISHLKQCATRLLETNEVDSILNFKIVEVRTASEIESLDGLIFPGGETTAMSILLEKNNRELLGALQNFAKVRPVFGTCAGLIMLANAIEGQMKMGQLKIGGIDITVRRNAYGGQLQSFEAPLNMMEPEILDSAATAMVFIRAPCIETVDSDKVKVLATYKNKPVAVRQNNLIGISFHPELTESLEWHLYFMRIIISEKLAKK
ncbi:pyridoxal 5'-phosphate synthase subunit PdxT-like [Bradysia coprophila]|uniref:pyridoxal 5'-phosphate synthase subunit PdxT-like n=1 Tax=Bradysia coprophila TaxID=38358 RepID=UPI00187DD689|nr:pyridoxal 5'-phosphate synthase subunit PdxT-like [Bradysia coprophila]